MLLFVYLFTCIMFAKGKQLLMFPFSAMIRLCSDAQAARGISWVRAHTDVHGHNLYSL